MPPKKKPRLPEDLPLYVYVTQTGAYIAGEEVSRDGAVLELKDPVFVNNAADGTSFDLQPVKFVAPGQTFRMYTYSLIGDTKMPVGIIPWYLKYQEQRAAQLAKQP